MKMTIDAFRAQLLAASGFRRADGRAGTVYEAIFPSDDTVSRYARESRRPAWQAGLPDVKGFGTVTDLSVAMANDLDLADLVAQRTRAMTAPKLKTLVAQAGDVLGAWGATLEATRELYAVRLGAGAGAGGATLLERRAWDGGALPEGWTLEQGWSPHGRRWKARRRDHVGRGCYLRRQRIGGNLFERVEIRCNS